jgi:hypothetical protein
MGFFDRLAGKKPSNPTPKPDATAPEPAGTPSGGLVPQLAAARERLDAKDLPGALALYEQILASAGDRPDVLVTISGDLGTCGYVEPIIELIAPRYDAERHGPATGINLVQAYLATRNPNAAQHLLDILFSLGRPELEERLWGFSNAIAEQIEAQRQGKLAASGAAGGAAAGPVTVELVSISKPIWAYGVDSLPGLLPAKDGRVRRLAFGQLATPGLADLEERMKKPEDDLGRFVRGFPLWLAETFVFSPLYAPIAAIGAVKQQNYALFPTEWTSENIRQLVETSSGGIDYAFTGAVREVSGDTELVLRVWEIKKFRERKTFTVRWSPATADRELANLHEQIRLFMEWTPYPAGAALPYTPSTRPTEWIHTLGASLSLFLADKQVIPAGHIPPTATWLDRVAENAVTTESASIAWLTAADRARRLGLIASAPAVQLAGGPLVDAAQQALG